MDPDNTLFQTQMFHFSMVDDAQGRFRIEHGRLHVNYSSQLCESELCTLNYEDKTSHTVTINVTDTGTPPLSKVFRLQIAVTDVNDAPTDLQLCSRTLFENSPPGTVIGMRLLWRWRIQGAPPAPSPQRDPILSFSHMFLPKSPCVGSRRPPTGNPGSVSALLIYQESDSLGY